MSKDKYKISETPKPIKYPFGKDKYSIASANYDKLKQTPEFNHCINVIIEGNTELIKQHGYTREQFVNAYIQLLEHYRISAEPSVFWSLLKFNDNGKLKGCYLSDTYDRERFYKTLQENKQC